MGTANKKKKYLVYIAILLAVVLLVTSGLMLLEVWEKSQGRFPSSDSADDVMTFDGQDYVLKDNIETFLVLGLDKYEGATSADDHLDGKQADFLMLFVFDNETKQCTAIHINRDTMANVNRLDISGNKLGTVKKQIALSYNYAYDNSGKISCRNTADSVSALLAGIKVEHYMSLTMDSVAKMNDLVGGVEVTVLDDFTGIDDTLVKGEKVTLMGEQALSYVRTRYGLEDSTNSTRMVRQRQYINALYDKISENIKAEDGFILKFVDAIDDYAVYDSTDYRMKEFAERFDEYEFKGIREIEGESKLGEEFMEFYPDEESIKSLVVELFYQPKVD